METKVVPILISSGISRGLDNQILMRTTPLRQWLTNDVLKERLSGTLRKNARIGFKFNSQLVQEAICQTMGWGFESLQTTYITFNDAITEGDCHSLTEVGWHVDRLLTINPFSEDYFEIKYINIQDLNGNIERQGVGIIVRETSIQWVSPSNLIFALLTEYNPKTNQWTDCVNPF